MTTTVQIVALDPDEARKAAAFVQALSAVEVRFGYRLDTGTDGGLRIAGTTAPFVVTRETGDDHLLTLALEVAS